MNPKQIAARRALVADEIRTGIERRVSATVPNASIGTLLPGWVAVIDSIAEAIVLEVDRRLG